MFVCSIHGFPLLQWCRQDGPLSVVLNFLVGMGWKDNCPNTLCRWATLLPIAQSDRPVQGWRVAQANLPFAGDTAPLGLHWEGYSSIVQLLCGNILVQCQSWGFHKSACLKVLVFSWTCLISSSIGEARFQYSRTELRWMVEIPGCHCCQSLNIKDTSAKPSWEQPSDSLCAKFVVGRKVSRNTNNANMFFVFTVLINSQGNGVFGWSECKRDKYGFTVKPSYSLHCIWWCEITCTA